MNSTVYCPRCSSTIYTTGPVCQARPRVLSTAPYDRKCYKRRRSWKSTDRALSPRVGPRSTKGGPDPPAIYTKPKGGPQADPNGYITEHDRQDSIVGHRGYITAEFEPGLLGICLFYQSAKGVKRARARIEEIGGVVCQEGDDEIAGAIPVDRIKKALQLIKVSKLHPGNDNFGNQPATSDPYAS